MGGENQGEKKKRITTLRADQRTFSPESIDVKKAVEPGPVVQAPPIPPVPYEPPQPKKGKAQHEQDKSS